VYRLSPSGSGSGRLAISLLNRRQAHAASIGTNKPVDLAHRQTHSLLLSHAAEAEAEDADGEDVKTFAEYIATLDKWITERSDAESAAGKEPIKRPVTLAFDNHTSRAVSSAQVCKSIDID